MIHLLPFKIWTRHVAGVVSDAVPRLCDVAVVDTVLAVVAVVVA